MSGDQLRPQNGCDHVGPEVPRGSQAVLITGEELRVTLDVAGKPVDFLIHMEAIYSFLTTRSGPICFL